MNTINVYKVKIDKEYYVFFHAISKNDIIEFLEFEPDSIEFIESSNTQADSFNVELCLYNPEKF